MSERGPGGVVSGAQGPRDQGLGHRGVVHQGLGRSALEGGEPGGRRGGRTSEELGRSEVVTAHMGHLVSAERLQAVLRYVVHTDRSVRGRHLAVLAGLRLSVAEWTVRLLSDQT